MVKTFLENNKNLESSVFDTLSEEELNVFKAQFSHRTPEFKKVFDALLQD